MSSFVYIYLFFSSFPPHMVVSCSQNPISVEKIKRINILWSNTSFSSEIGTILQVMSLLFGRIAFERLRIQNLFTMKIMALRNKKYPAYNSHTWIVRFHAENWNFHTPSHFDLSFLFFQPKTTSATSSYHILATVTYYIVV